jgi:hypothetical protein
MLQRNNVPLGGGSGRKKSTDINCLGATMMVAVDIDLEELCGEVVCSYVKIAEMNDKEINTAEHN